MNFKYLDIDDAQLKENILSLFKKAHVKIKNAYAINFSTKTKKAKEVLKKNFNSKLLKTQIQFYVEIETTASEICSVIFS